MFGEKEIHGSAEMFVDDKGRMILPKFTHREAGEHLVVVNNQASNSYDVYSKKVYEDKIKYQIEFLEQKLTTTIDVNKRKQIQCLLDELYTSILAEVVCDKQNRINISSIFKKDETFDHVMVIGAFNHLMIQKPKQKNKKK